MMLTEQELLEKWSPVLNEDSVPEIKDPYRRAVTAILLENQEQALAEAAPTNVASGVAGYDPVLISMVRRAMPHLIAYDVCGVQPMTTPTGLVFAMRSRYSGQNGVEALWNEANTFNAGAQANMLASQEVTLSGAQTGSAGSTTYTVTSTTGILPGMALTVVTAGNGTGSIPAGTIVVAVASTTTVTLNQAVTNAPGTTSVIKFGLPGYTGAQLPGALVLPSTAQSGVTITLSTANAALIEVGMPVAGSGITGPAIVSAVNTGTGVITLSPATVNGVTGVLSTLSASASYQFGDSVGTGIPTATGEGVTPATMGFTIEKITVTAQTYQLSTGYSVELAQDMKALHGLDADTELSNILGAELLAEQNRVVLRSLYNVAKAGAQKSTTAGVVNVAANSGADTGGRYLAEKFRGLQFVIQRDVNAIGTDVRFGKGNFLIVSADVAAALAAAGQLNYAPAIQAWEGLAADFTQNTYVGQLGQLKVYVDPYATSDFYMVGYKGSNPYQAGLFFCPYVPAQLLRATDPTTFQPLLAMKMRYGITYNPLATAINGVGGNFRQNGFYRIAAVTNLVQ